MYGCSLWSLSSSSIKLCEVALKKLLRKLWHLPRNSHSTIVHCVAQIDTISAIVLRRFLSLLSSALSSSSSLVQSIFSMSSSSVYSFTGYNNVYGAKHLIDYSYSDLSFANMIRRIRHCYGSYSPCEDLISVYSYFTLSFPVLYICGLVASPGALKPSVGDGTESSWPLVHTYLFSAIFSSFFH